MKHDKYWYHIEDGQFSFDVELDDLIGIEGNKINFSNYFPEYTYDVYILFVENNHIECIGEIQRNFPKTPYEHEELKTQVKQLYSTL